MSLLLRLAMNHLGEVLIETRGEGAMAKTYPSEGYKLKQGSFDNVPIITPEERLEILVSCKLLTEDIPTKAFRQFKSEYKPQFEEFNSNPQIGINMLLEHGWEVFKNEDRRVLLTKPDATSKKVSAIYNLENFPFLWVFSTSTGFNPERAYKNSDIYAELIYEGDYTGAYKDLFDQGYGNEEDGDVLNEYELRDVKFLSEKEEEMDYLNKAIQDEIPFGLNTGWVDVDKHFRFKRNHFVVGIGFEGVGKSFFMLNMAMASHKRHGWKWGMVVPENKTALTRRRLIEISSGKKISYYKDSPKILNKYMDMTYENFFVVSNKKHLSIEEALEMGKRLYQEKKIDALLLDPYNFFRVDTSNGYVWDNKILSLIRVFVEKYCSVYLMLHPNTDSGRAGKDPQGFILPPNQYSVTGGNNFVNRCDDFFTLHRIRNHPDEAIRKTLQFIVYKIKEEETGGRVHSHGEYTSLKYETRKGFTGFFDSKGCCPMR